jgi:hypothetical protein
MDDPALLCSASTCLTSRPFSDLVQIPRPERGGAWVPAEPGHYIVQAHLSGDNSLSCQIDLDVVEGSDALIERGGENPYRWAACLGESPYPVNNPGLPPFAIEGEDVTIANDSLGLEFTVTPRRDELLRAWFILSPRGLPDPWRAAAYESPIKEQWARAGEPARFEWSASPPDSLPTGAYGLTVWVHHQAGEAWRHAVGGPAMDEAVLVDADGMLRRAGPLLIQMRGTLTSAKPGETVHLPMEVKGAQGLSDCSLRWRLVHADGTDERVGVADCSYPSLNIPPDTQSGVYRLSVEIYTGEGMVGQLSDGIVMAITVTDAADERPK